MFAVSFKTIYACNMSEYINDNAMNWNNLADFLFLFDKKALQFFYGEILPGDYVMWIKNTIYLQTVIDDDENVRRLSFTTVSTTTTMYVLLWNNWYDGFHLRQNAP
jgi:hypothetical protein